jgi:hypothetical protein
MTASYFFKGNKSYQRVLFPMSPAAIVMTGLGMTVGIGATEEVAEADFSISGWTIMLTTADAVDERALQKKCSV